MKDIEFGEVKSRAIQISELIEEIIKLDDLLALHKSFQSEGVEANQYRERRQGFIEELNKLLTTHHLKLIVEEKVA
ncbi:MAG: hypothetical protein AAGI38_07210 [Bacteroidota bacterium]